MSVLSAGVPRAIVEFCIEQYGLTEFIETGTFRGESTEFAAGLFEFVLSIEIDEANYKAAK